MSVWEFASEIYVLLARNISNRRHVYVTDQGSEVKRGIEGEKGIEERNGKREFVGEREGEMGQRGTDRERV